ncbi:hypothetical protein ACD591_08305 [Rufibacter glacialis]|uniref:DUF2029 domain-containing protein n=1 Tax=Rufibacter glacialis TaxID=1259555 RepID=A0A5M8QBX2_9BACT|nr:hypothetical protein [Rufibacter glacialis]KAA6432551.1 hypothetical protein FOE74_15805 [Rufibacter glacialis]GGK79738.1 hypothetical protein GCM10011405_29410 [Rufibacter glacialis]
MKAKIPLWYGLGLGLVLRLVLLLAMPALSDDYARFLWDGHLLQNGLNPYLNLPSDWMEVGAPLPAGLSPALYQTLNSPQYYSVYPPVCQFIFWVSTLIKGDVLASVVMMRVCVMLAEAGTLWLLPKVLQRLHLPPAQALWYALNPAVILELTGNLHFEAFMIFFLVSAFYFFSGKRWALAAVCLGLSVGSKLLPLLLLPLLPRYLGWPKAVAVGLLVGLTLLLLFSPFLSPDLVAHLGSSLTLYFQKFEFNASVYYLLRAVGFWLAGFNLISFLGLGLPILTLAGALWLGFGQPAQPKSFPWLVIASLGLMSLYFFLSTTVHPWYLSTLVALACGTRYRFPMVWSGMAILSYAAYQTTAYRENLWLVALEYGVVFFFLGWEWRKERQKHASVFAG